MAAQTKKLHEVFLKNKQMNNTITGMKDTVEESIAE